MNDHLDRERLKSKGNFKLGNPSKSAVASDRSELYDVVLKMGFMGRVGHGMCMR